MVDLPKKVGWVGLGIMGLPMIRNLLAKMKDDTQFFVYDVVQASIDQIVQDGKGRVHACSSSKEVADNSVRQLCAHSCHLNVLTTIV
jgi:3-hydroxyisobutyrate dehydrogenase